MFMYFCIFVGNNTYFSFIHIEGPHLARDLNPPAADEFLRVLVMRSDGAAGAGIGRVTRQDEIALAECADDLQIQVGDREERNENGEENVDDLRVVEELVEGRRVAQCFGQRLVLVDLQFVLLIVIKI